MLLITALRYLLLPQNASNCTGGGGGGAVKILGTCALTLGGGGGIRTCAITLGGSKYKEPVLWYWFSMFCQTVSPTPVWLCIPGSHRLLKAKKKTIPRLSFGQSIAHKSAADAMIFCINRSDVMHRWYILYIIHINLCCSLYWSYISYPLSEMRAINWNAATLFIPYCDVMLCYQMQRIEVWC